VSKLAPGSAVRVLRGGSDHVAQVTSPADGTNLGIRTLEPGAYVAADECGNEVAFIVDAPNELVVLEVDGSRKGAAVTVSGPGGRVVDVVPPAEDLTGGLAPSAQAPVQAVDRDAVENVDVRPVGRKAPRAPRPSELAAREAKAAGKKPAKKRRNPLRRKK